MITNANNYTKKKTNKQKTDRQNPRTNGKSKAIQTKLQTEAYTYTFTKKENGKNIYIYLCSLSPPPQFGMIRCLFRYSTGAGTST